MRAGGKQLNLLVGETWRLTHQLFIPTSLKATTSMIEPLMICVMGVIVGGIALGLLMPIFQLSKPG